MSNPAETLQSCTFELPLADHFRFQSADDLKQDAPTDLLSKFSLVDFLSSFPQIEIVDEKHAVKVEPKSSKQTLLFDTEDGGKTKNTIKDN
jgi:hypothetical protein